MSHKDSDDDASEEEATIKQFIRRRYLECLLQFREMSTLRFKVKKCGIHSKHKRLYNCKVQGAPQSITALVLSFYRTL